MGLEILDWDFKIGTGLRFDGWRLGFEGWRSGLDFMVLGIWGWVFLEFASWKLELGFDEEFGV